MVELARILDPDSVDRSAAPPSHGELGDLSPDARVDPEEFPIPESSGSGFFTFGLAWGVNNNLLDAETTLPAIRRGWAGLNWALQPSGKLGWVQQIGYDPRSVTADDSMEYGTGGFLLAGSEMLGLGACRE